MPLFRFLYRSAEHVWWSAVSEARWTEAVNPQVEEVAWHAFRTEEELTRQLGEWNWVPDGLQAYHRMLAWRAARPDGDGSDGDGSSDGTAGQDSPRIC